MCASPVFSFSGCPYSSLHDASVFVGDASLGSGPAGLNVLSACRLSGHGTTTIGAVVYFDELARPCVLNVDQTLDIDARTASDGAIQVSNVCRKIFEERAAPVAKRLRAIDSAAMVAAATSTKVRWAAPHARSSLLPQAVLWHQPRSRCVVV